MARKKRVAIETSVSAQVLFESDRTCCVCRDRGLAVQIHHIDEDPGNNAPENLSVLCLQCHNETQLRGGFGRKLDASQITEFRDDWLARVQKRRDDADKLASLNQSKVQISDEATNKFDDKEIKYDWDTQPILAYINSLPTLKAALISQAQPRWDTGVTSEMVQASYDYIDSLTGILVILAGNYASDQFGNQTSTEYFSDVVSSRFRWHRTIAEPEGPGSGGTIVNLMVCSGVTSDVEKMVEDVVSSLVGLDDEFDWVNWPRRWQEAGKT